MIRASYFSMVAALCSIAAITHSGCKGAADADKAPVIGLTVPSLTHPFFIFLQENVLDEAKILGVEVITADAEDSAARQMAIVEDFIARGVDGVLMSPIGADSLVPAVEALNRAGIPVATVDRKVSAGEVLVHVGADNVEGGRLAAQYLILKLGGEGKVIELEGTPGSSPAIDRGAGFHEVVRGTGIELVASQSANFQRAAGQIVMENLLQVHRDVEAVFAANDEMILGALEAIEAAGIDEKQVVTIGYDAIANALDYIQAGRLDATVEQYPGRQARTALRLLVEHLREGSLPESREVYITPVVITAENLDQAEQMGTQNGDK